MFASLYLIQQSYALIEEVEATPTNTNAIELGELSLPQFIWLTIVFLKFVLLYAVGVIPLEIDLGGTFFEGRAMNEKSSVANNEVSYFISSKRVKKYSSK